MNMNNINIVKRTDIMRIIIGFVLFAVIGILGYEIVKINMDYPQAKIVVKEINEKGMVGNHIQFSVSSAEWMNRAQMLEKYGNVLEFSDKFDYLGVIVNATLKNTGKKKENVELYKWYLESDTYYCNGLDMEMFFEDNEEAALNFTLKKGEERTVSLPYSISSVSFSEKEWEKFKEDTFYIVSERYPVKIYWSIK